MKSYHLPRIDARYWAGITMASVFGTNTGDVFADWLGILGGVPFLAAIVGIAYFLEHRDKSKHEAWYWLAIIVIRTGATNIADFVCGRRYLGVNRILFSTALAIFIAIMAYWQLKKKKDDQYAGLPRTDANYWIAMLAAGVFGTAGGDAVLGAFGGPRGVGGIQASILLSAILGILLIFGRGGRIQKIFYYWLTICVARTAGTAIADMLAENKSWAIGLPLSTTITGLVFVGVLVLWRPRPRTETVPA
jgi:uncharacterized membrane-anchored protein